VPLCRERNSPERARVHHRRCTYKRNIEERSLNRGKEVSITYSGCVFVDLGTQHATRMRYIVIFLHYLIKGLIFEKRLLSMKCVFVLFTAFV
jgi:hypothetical protein